MYESPTWKGWAYIHGRPFGNTLTTAGVAASESYDSKEGEVSSITDEPHGFGLYNEVTHTKEVWDCPLQPIISRHESVYQGCPFYVDSTGLSAASTGAVGWAINRPTFVESEENFVQRAIARMEFGVQSGPFNAPVFLGELRDYKSVANRIAGWLKPKNGKSVLKDYQRFQRNFRNANALDGIRALAAADLTYQFAIKPLISDLQGLMTMGQHINAQLDRLNSSKPVIVRGSAHDETSEEEITFDAGNQAKYNLTTTNCRAKRTCTAWAQIQYDFANTPRPSEKLLLLDALGVDQPITAIWELVPFSFLVDYFIEVGDFLSQFDGSLVELPYTLIQDGYSVKTEYTGTVTTVFDNGDWSRDWSNKEGPGKATGRLSKTIYKRRKGPLNYEGIALPKLTLPNLRQLGNIGELILLNG